ncbi:MAG: hypothetical protein OEV66_10565, partial [Spirochaetia bacterium]|nr:hypothetical protein [Spirochaetia bacterium]
MKNLPYFLITFFMISLGSSLMGQKFGRYQVAVIPGGNNNVYSGMVQKALGEDKRFLFISDKDIPIIMKEWEKRQSGITENDSVSMLKNVDYFVEVANVQISGPIRIENKDSKGNITVTYQTGISIDIKVTDIQGGGEIKMRSASGQGNDSNIGLSQQEAQRGLQSSIAVSVEILFPIVAELYDVNSSHAKILSGSQQGVKSGQKYIVKNKKTIHIRDKERTLVNDVGLIQINKVNDDNSEAFVILGDMIENNDL